MEGLAGKTTSSLHESNFVCYNYTNGIPVTSTADEYNFMSYNCISNITICGRTTEEDYPKLTITLHLTLTDPLNTIIYMAFNLGES